MDKVPASAVEVNLPSEVGEVLVYARRVGRDTQIRQGGIRTRVYSEDSESKV